MGECEVIDMRKKIKKIIVTLMICVLAFSTTTFAAENSERATNMHQETVAVSSALTAYGSAVQFSGKKLMVSANTFNIANSPSSLTIVLQRKNMFGIWGDTKHSATISISTNVQDVFYGIDIDPGDTYRFKYILNSEGGSYVNVSLGAASY